MILHDGRGAFFFPELIKIGKGGQVIISIISFLYLLSCSVIHSDFLLLYISSLSVLEPRELHT